MQQEDSGGYPVEYTTAFVTAKTINKQADKSCISVNLNGIPHVNF